MKINNCQKCDVEPVVELHQLSNDTLFMLKCEVCGKATRLFTATQFVGNINAWNRGKCK